jgi:hypothetical protein
VLVPTTNGRSIIVVLSQRLLAFCCLLVLSVPAHAYVDPGTGSLAVQFLIGGAVALAFTIKTYYYAIRKKIRSMLGRPDPTAIDVESDKADAASVKDQGH